MFRHTRSAGIMSVLCSCDEDGCCTCCSVCLYSYMCSSQPPKTHFGSYLNTVCRFSHLHESVCAWYPWSSPAFPSCSVSVWAWSRQSSVYVWDLRWHHTSVLKSSSLPKIKTGDSLVSLSLSLSCLYFFGIQQKVKTTKIIKSMHHFSVVFAIVLAHSNILM